MAVANLGTKVIFGATGVAAITVASATSAGTLVVVFVQDGYNVLTGTSVTDTQSNSYTQIVNKSLNGGSNVQIFYSVLTTSLTTSDTITYHVASGFSGSQTLNASAASATGYALLDTATTASADGFSAAYTVTGAGAAAVANEIYFGFVMTGTALGATPTGWSTTPPNTPTAANFLACYQVNSGTSALTFNGALTSGAWTTAIVSFQPAAAPDVLFPQISM